MKQEFEFKKIEIEDIPQIRNLAAKNGGNKNLNEKNFKFWYLNNPTKSYSLWKVEKNSTIEGYATTNNFFYTVNGEAKLAALPQNVLTSENIRGKGMFGKLYQQTEVENLEVNNVDFFLTSTGAMSTPIFLAKFGYVKARSPVVLVKLPSLNTLFSKKKYRLLNDIKEIKMTSNINLNNSRKKTPEYFFWRYSSCEKENLRIIEVVDNEKIVGYAFLIVKRKFGIKAVILADILTSSENNYTPIIDACHSYVSKRLFAPMIMFKIETNCKNKGFNVEIKDRFNILTKGKSEEETKTLGNLNFNFFFGDLDYFW